jgi:deoxycytidine triphosphate deaminase
VIASDKWIRKMALEHGMITPFVEKLVTTGKVSYGLSSYGYDVRVGRKFKIFHNLNSTLIDPKAFDPRSFVDHDGDCIIPPNSFVLAETVERFRMPRNSLAVCVGKCVSGDTRVLDAGTGEYLPIRQFAGRRRTVGLDGWRARALPVTDFVPQGVRPVFELVTRSGLRIKATANHPFRQLHGWTALEDLQVGDRIAAVREVPTFGRSTLADWEAALLGLMISDGACRTPGHSPTYTSSDPVLVSVFEESVREGLGCQVTHDGRMGYRIVNHQGRGGAPERNRATTWLEGLGLAVKAAEKHVPQRVFRATRNGAARFLQALFSGDGSAYGDGRTARVEYSSMSRRLVEDVHHLLLRFGILGQIREKTTALGTTAYMWQTTDRRMALRFATELGFWPRSKKQQALERLIPPLLEQGRVKSNFDTLPQAAWMHARGAAAARDLTARAIGVPRLSEERQSLGWEVATRVALATRDEELLSLVRGGPFWDVVESITPAGEEPVFDLTVPGASNFLANDLFVHNSTYARCGIIVNVTPIEPEWEGVITIEISNTTPLPAKIYADEGIAQLLFFLGDEVCETSYADRKGKYQNQSGLTLPKILKGGAP